jgi:hypothetical protein
VRVPIFLALEVAANLHDSVEVEPGGAKDAAQVFVRAAGFVVERVVNDSAVLIGGGHP